MIPTAVVGFPNGHRVVCEVDIAIVAEEFGHVGEFSRSVSSGSRLGNLNAGYHGSLGPSKVIEAGEDR